MEAVQAPEDAEHLFWGCRRIARAREAHGWEHPEGLVPSSPTPIQGSSVATFLWSSASPPVNWGHSPFAHRASVRYHRDTNRAAGTQFPLVFFLTLSGHSPRATNSL